MKQVIVCSPKSLPREKLVQAARDAVRINPLNHAPLERLTRLVPEFDLSPDRIAVVTTKYWGLQGVRLTVQFVDNAPSDLRKRILKHLNAWGQNANIKFIETMKDGQVRIAREGGVNGGYWSYVGTDILQIPAAEQTMNLEAFTTSTPESEFVRVVRHEAGHTLGFPHEHMRKALVEKIDERKAIDYFMRTQGWSEQEVRAQVLTPLEESSLISTTANPKSIMCYQIPGTLTKDGKPILGGKDIDASDHAFVARIYPKKTTTRPAKKKKSTRAAKKKSTARAGR